MLCFFRPDNIFKPSYENDQWWKFDGWTGRFLMDWAYFLAVLFNIDNWFDGRWMTSDKVPSASFSLVWLIFSSVFDSTMINVCKRWKSTFHCNVSLNEKFSWVIEVPSFVQLVLRRSAMFEHFKEELWRSIGGIFSSNENSDKKRRKYFDFVVFCGWRFVVLQSAADRAIETRTKRLSPRLFVQRRQISSTSKMRNSSLE